jgi:hypothetical protein
MDDFLYLAIVVIAFMFTIGLMKLCDVLGQSKSGEKPPKEFSA